MAEALLRHLGGDRFEVFSAGSAPAGFVHPLAMEAMERMRVPMPDAVSKSWEEFAGQPFDLVVTVCDRAAAEPCPLWHGPTRTVHWGLPDPAAAEGNEAEKRLAFAETYRMLRNRISIFVSLPLASIEKLALRERLSEIGRDRAWADIE